MSDARGPDEDTEQDTAEVWPGTGSASSSGPALPKRSRENKAEAALEALALRGSCVKDGGVAHAMLLVPMRTEQRRLLPVRGLPQQLEARLRAVVRATFCLAPQPWHGHALERRMIQLQADRKLALATVERRGLALQHVPAELKDRDLVLTAVRSRARALEFAPPRLQQDREVVLAALAAPGGHKALAFTACFSQDEEIQVAVQRTREKVEERRRRMDEDLCEQVGALRPSGPSDPPSSHQPLAQILPDEVLCLLHL